MKRGPASEKARWTPPSAIPPDVARKIVAAREALLASDPDEAYHQLYAIANPGFDCATPWALIEAQAGRP